MPPSRFTTFVKSKAEGAEAIESPFSEKLPSGSETLFPIVERLFTSFTIVVSELIKLATLPKPRAVSKIA